MPPANRELSVCSGIATGKLSTPCCPFKRRQYEKHSGWNVQLESSVCWWILALHGLQPRPVPTSLSLPPTVVTYSDGEGSAKGGLGICIFQPGTGRRPQAAFMEVPEEVRRMWPMQEGRSAKADIFEIEGVGPSATVTTWPQLIEGCPWLHFIDHQGTQMCLVRGSGNSRNGDVIAGLTWTAVQKTQSWFWMERVMSESNPIDGVSRGRKAGPCLEVEECRLPRVLLRDLRQKGLREGFF